MKGKVIFETKRLIIREFTHADAKFIIALLNSPGWLKNIGDRRVHNENDAISYLEKGPLKSYATHKFGLWKVELKENGAPAGMCGLLKRDSLADPDIGFAFLPEYNGLGYALESASACLEFAKAQGLERICAITLPENLNSIRLLEKLGLHYEKEILMPPDGERLFLYVTK